MKYSYYPIMIVTLVAMAAPLNAAAQDAAADTGQTVGARIPDATGLSSSPQMVEPLTWQPLARRGVTLSLNYTGEAAANPTGGLRQDAAFAGQVYAGMDFDLERIAGLNGGSLHVAATNRHGKSLTAIAIGNNTSVQEIWGTQNTHLAIFTYQQKMFGDRLDVEVGRSQANVYFLNSPLYCAFQSNSACGNPTFIFKVSNFTYFPASSWMAHATAKITPALYAHVGVFEVNPDRKRPEDHGVNFGMRRATGVIIPYEVGYGSDAATDRLPRHYAVGGWFDRGDYADPLRDDRGGIAVLTGRPAATLHGRSGVFARFDQMLTRPDPQSLRGLTVFGVAMANVSGRVSQTRFVELGAVQTGTFPGRDKDTLGFVINDQRFSDLALDAIRAARTSRGGTSDLPRHQYMMELAYGVQLNDTVRISPNVQYIANPDQSGSPFRTRDIRDALVLGFKFTIDGLALAERMRPR